MACFYIEYGKHIFLKEDNEGNGNTTELMLVVDMVFR